MKRSGLNYTFGVNASTLTLLDADTCLYVRNDVNASEYLIANHAAEIIITRHAAETLRSHHTAIYMVLLEVSLSLHFASGKQVEVTPVSTFKAVIQV